MFECSVLLRPYRVRSVISIDTNDVARIGTTPAAEAFTIAQRDTPDRRRGLFDPHHARPCDVDEAAVRRNLTRQFGWRVRPGDRVVVHQPDDVGAVSSMAREVRSKSRVPPVFRVSVRTCGCAALRATTAELSVDPLPMTGSHRRSASVHPASPRTRVYVRPLVRDDHGHDTAGSVVVMVGSGRPSAHHHRPPRRHIPQQPAYGDADRSAAVRVC